MTEHLSTGIMERFERQEITPSDRHEIYDHARVCEGCRKRIVDSRGESTVLRELVGHLLPDDSEEPYHLEFEMIEGYMDNTLDRIDRDTVEMHLEVCSECCAEVVDFRDSLATMRAAWLSQINTAEKPALGDSIRAFPSLVRLTYAFRVPAIVALTLLAIVAVVVLRRMRPPEQAQSNSSTSNRQGIAQQSSPIPVQPSPYITIPGLKSALAGMKSPKAPSRTLAKNDDSQAVVLNDGMNRITLDKAGNLTGLADVPDEDRQAIKDVLSAAAIKKPDVLTDLIGRAGVLRGNSGGETIKQLYPGKTVIVEDRPLFKWSPLKEASGYRVSVGDSNFHGAAKSEDLPSTTTEWRPSTPLKRGMVYTWIVTAVKDGVEISVASSEPEMKFKVLDAQKMTELEHLKSGSQSRLALGVFYAREGMIAESEREFEALVQENPRSAVALKLLKEIQSWRKR